MKLTTTTQVSVDGVMQGNGPSEEDRKAGFERDVAAAIGELKAKPGGELDIALDLVDSRAFPKGVTLQVYRPAGRPQYATD